MESLYEREKYSVHSFNWGSILAGSFVALGIYLFLLALGAAIGGGGPANGWTGFYVVVSPIIALFCGGLVVSRSHGGDEGKVGAGLHGAVVWGFSVSIGALLTGTIGPALVAGGHLPAGYLWAVAGMLLASLVACVLGASMNQSSNRGRVMTRREAHP